MTEHYAPLHVHSAYSLLDGLIRIPDLAAQAQRMGLKACAITDHGNLAGAVKWTDAAIKAGVKPLIGQEFYIAPDSRLRRGYPKGAHTASHLIIFAKNDIGWQNIIKLSSEAYISGFYKKPRIDHELLEMYSDGLIVTSACIGGDIAIHLKGGLDPEGDCKVEYNYAQAIGNAQWYMDLFEDDFYFEMQSYKQPYQEAVNAFYRTHFPADQLIATADCHYLTAAEADTHDTLIACQSVRYKGDATRWRFVSDQFFLKTEAEMLQNFFHQEVYNTGKLADKITFELPLRKTFYMPELPADIVGEDQVSTFIVHTLNGMQERLGMNFAYFKTREKIGITPLEGDANGEVMYAERLEYELNILIKAQYVEYFLLLHDLKAWCRSEGIFTGPGRGSGCGSLVLYALFITDVDPIERACPFERFINPGRLENFSPPDVDLDFPQSRRGDIIEYLRQRYGRDRVCQIGTYASLGPAALIRKLKVPLGLSDDDVADLTKAIPANEGSVQGRGAAGDIGSSKTVEEVFNESPIFARKIASMGYQGEAIMKYGRGLAYLGDHASTHASGLIITNRAVETLVPLMTVKGNATGRDVMSQMDMVDVEALGLVKYDILGLVTLDLLAYVQREIKANHDPAFIFANIDMDDPIPYRLLHDGRTAGVFQAEGGGLGTTLEQARPESIEELAVLNSLCRPGPMQAGITQLYIERKAGRAEVTYEIPQLEPILRDSLGLICFQEHIMSIASECAGYSPSEADDLRKIMGKKQRDKMAYQKEKFINGLARVIGVDEFRGEKLWNEIEKMSEYVFNRGHSIAYSYLTSWCVWAKAYYPSYFLAAAMTAESVGDGEELPSLLQDSRYLGVAISRPDINESHLYYHAINDGLVRVGFRGIRGVGPAAVTAILKERENGPFLSRDDFRARIPAKDANKTVIAALEDAGAFDMLDGRTRRVTVESLLQEFSIFGFFLSGNPCSMMRDVWFAENPNLTSIDMCLRTTKQILVPKKTKYGERRVLEYVPGLVRGVVTKYDSKRSKNKAGVTMHFFDIEDESGVAKVFLKNKDLDRLGITSIKKGMGLEILGSRSSSSSRAKYIEPSYMREFSFST